MGAIGSGTWILLAVTIVYNFFETVERERQNDALAGTGMGQAF